MRPRSMLTSWLDKSDYDNLSIYGHIFLFRHWKPESHEKRMIGSGIVWWPDVVSVTPLRH